MSAESKDQDSEYQILVHKESYNRPSDKQYETYRHLVHKGPSGWELLFEIQSTLDSRGDIVREISSLWETSGLQTEQVEAFSQAERAYINKKAANETWALLYARAYLEVARGPRRDTLVWRIDRIFETIEQQQALPPNLLIEIAYLRILFLEDDAFPGHQFPWNKSSTEQKEAVSRVIQWWSEHREEYLKKQGTDGY